MYNDINKIGGVNMRKWPWLKIFWYLFLIFIAIREASDKADEVS